MSSGKRMPLWKKTAISAAIGFVVTYAGTLIGVPLLVSAGLSGAIGFWIGWTL